jgi:hypothetical protein
MPARPNFTAAELDEAEDTVRLSGNSNDQPLPVEIRVFLEQGTAQASGAEVALGPVNRLNTAWVAELSAPGFTKGPALASGVEVRMEPFTVTSWTEQVIL